MLQMKLVQLFCSAMFALLAPVAAYAYDGTRAATDAGVSGLWMLANISYAGMRAQNNPNVVWRIIAFIAGFPGTLISLLAVAQGSDRAYGIDIPKSTRNPGVSS
jgi:hypothetical protein